MTQEAEEGRRKGKVPKEQRDLKFCSWAWSEELHDCHRKMECYQKKIRIFHYGFFEGVHSVYTFLNVLIGELERRFYHGDF